MDPRVKKHQILERMEAVKKSPIIALALCLFGGFWGLHRYYLGHVKMAGIMAAIWLVLVIFFAFNLIAALIWGFADIFLFLNENAARFMMVDKMQQSGDPQSAQTLSDQLQILFKYLPVLAYAGFVIWELVRVSRLTEDYNRARRKEIEKTLQGKV